MQVCEILRANVMQLFTLFFFLALPFHLAQIHPGCGIFPALINISWNITCTVFHYNTCHCKSPSIYEILRDWPVQSFSRRPTLSVFTSDTNNHTVQKNIQMFPNKKRVQTQDVVPGTALQLVNKPQDFEQNGR